MLQIVHYLFFLHRSLQYFTSCHTFSHFFRQVKGLLQVRQVLVGRFSFFMAFIRLVGCLTVVKIAPHWLNAAAAWRAAFYQTCLPACPSGGFLEKSCGVYA